MESVCPHVRLLKSIQAELFATCKVLRVGRISGRDIDQAKRLRIISRNGTGCDTIDLDSAKEKGIVVTNVPGGNAKVCCFCF